MWPRSAPGPLLPSKKVKHQINYQHRHRKYSRINKSDQNESQIVSKSNQILSEAPIESFVAGIT